MENHGLTKKGSRGRKSGQLSNCCLLKYKSSAQPPTHAPMSPPFLQNTHLAVLAVVSALLVLKATKRAPKKPLLLNDLKDVASQVDASGVSGQQLFGSEYDIIIVGGGEFPFVSRRLGPLNDYYLL